jgi:hypothetical protein
MRNATENLIVGALALVGGIVIIGALMCASGLGIWLLWNTVAAGLFHLPHLSFLKAVAIGVALTIVFPRK